MKITGTRSTLIVEIEDKLLIIKGELTLTPTFYADSDSIVSWEAPFENTRIKEAEKLEIIDQILKYTENQEVKIMFE